MDDEAAIRAFSALAQAHRMALFRALVRAGEEGMTAGQLADAVGIAPTALSFHAKELDRSGLVRQSREGRFIRYRLDVAAMRDLIGFLVDDCCSGHPELCWSGLAGGCAPRGESSDVCCDAKGACNESSR